MLSGVPIHNTKAAKTSAGGDTLVPGCTAASVSNAAVLKTRSQVFSTVKAYVSVRQDIR